MPARDPDGVRMRGRDLSGATRDPSFAAALRRGRRRAGLTLFDLARRVRLPPRGRLLRRAPSLGYLSELEHGRKLPAPELAAQLARALGLSPLVLARRARREIAQRAIERRSRA